MRVLILILVCLGAGALVVGYYVWRESSLAVQAQPDPDVIEIEDSAQLRLLQAGPHMLFINTHPGPHAGRVALVPLHDLNGPRYLTPLRCARVDFAGGTGVCLSSASGFTSSHSVHTFDRDFAPRSRLPLQGFPSRARVAADGSMSAMTVFVRGDSYASNSLSTRTTLLDVAAQRQIAELEEFVAWRDGQRFKAIDFNYWGVTFLKQPDQFYATLATGGKLLLVHGRIGAREVRVVREGVECPSLSPDERRIVYKSRYTDGAATSWRLRVASLDAAEETTISEERSVDDQAAWLDNDHVLYALRHQDSSLASKGVTDIWVAPADGRGPARLFLKKAYSPAIVQPDAR